VGIEGHRKSARRRACRDRGGTSRTGGRRRALDAVCAAVLVLEDDPLFNAGTGCVLNRDGAAEMDAAVMAGEDLRCGGVAAITRVRNPVLVARQVMEATPHVLLAGAGATAFARAHGFAEYDPVTRESLRRFRLRAAVASPGRSARWPSMPTATSATRPAPSRAPQPRRRHADSSAGNYATATRRHRPLARGADDAHARDEIGVT
jgi:beta-aspartyl-peptidase (threonine type)